MLRIDNPTGQTIEPAVQTGYSMLRYNGFAECPSLPALRDRLTRETPDLVAIGLNLMCTQLPDGTLTTGDAHSYATTLPPLEDEEPFLDATPAEGVRVVAVTAGIGMTTAFGFAREVMEDLMGQVGGY